MAQCEVIGNQPVTLPSLVGGFERGRKITFKTPSGTVGIVNVTDAQVVDGSWQGIIEAECAKLEAINRFGQCAVAGSCLPAAPSPSLLLGW